MSKIFLNTIAKLQEENAALKAQLNKAALIAKEYYNDGDWDKDTAEAIYNSIKDIIASKL